MSRPFAARHWRGLVVTGSSAGFGFAIAEALARAGSTVVIASRSAERCEEAAWIGRPALGHACDVTDEDSVRCGVGREQDADRPSVFFDKVGVPAQQGPWGDDQAHPAELAAS